MNNHYLNQLRQFAAKNPKSSSAMLVVSTAIACATIVVSIELCDRYNNNLQNHSVPAKDMLYSTNEAQLAAMVENAKSSSWQENLRNASDAQQRFMLPGRDIDNDVDTPEYVKRIDERSQEILREDTERRERERQEESDPSRTRFWR